MQREAQALAKLSHPNVVQVYDVGSLEGQLYLAMEFVDGVTLQRWLKAEARGWRDVLAMFIQAGRGLEAAHAAGLVHRDFKPQNVLVGRDGRARVLDFGLAKRDGERGGSWPGGARGADASEASEASEASMSVSMSLSSPLTEAGTYLGTPAYMSPEQHRADEADARSDQFSYCVALYEGLYGLRPFAATSRSELVLHVCSGRLREPPRSARVPAWVYKTIVRGLAPTPSERWPTMTALLAALERDPGRWARRVGAGVCAAAVAVAGSYELARRQAERALAESYACSGAQGRVGALWGVAEAERLREAFAGTGLAYAAEVGERVVARLDDYARRWAELYTEACQANRRGELSDEQLDLRMRCLDERAQHLAARARIFAAADGVVVENAAQAAASLPLLSRCEDHEYLSASVRPPEDPALARAVDELRGGLATALSQINAGDLRAGAALADSLRARAFELRYKPIRAYASLVAGSAANSLGELDEAAALFEEAYHLALEAKTDEHAATAAASLVFVHGARRADTEAAARWAPHATSMVRRVGPRARAYAILENGLGALSLRTGDLDASLEHFDAAIRWYESIEGPPAPELGRILLNRASALGIQGRVQESMKSSLRAQELLEQIVGTEHPLLAHVHANRGSGYFQQGDFKAARAEYARAVEISERAFGLEHLDNALFLLNLSSAQRRQGELEAALKSLERARAIRERALGPDNPQLASVINNIADIERQRGHLERALELFQKARALKLELVGEGNRELLLYDLGVTEVLLDQGRADEALERIELAFALERVEESAPIWLGELYFLRARALAAARGRGQRARALADARRAREHFMAAGEQHHEALAKIDAWIAAQG